MHTHGRAHRGSSVSASSQIGKAVGRENMRDGRDVPSSCMGAHPPDGSALGATCVPRPKPLANPIGAYTSN